MTVQGASLPELSRIDRSTVKDLALDQLKRYIASGAVVPGQRLPSERELAHRLGVGRNSVREALKVLGAVGLVEVRVGEGTFISEQTGSSIGRTIGLSLAAGGGALIEIIQARQMIEVEACAIAADKARPDDIDGLRTCLQSMERFAREGKVHDYLTADMGFHARIARATYNSIISVIITNLTDILAEVLRDAQAEQLEPMVESGASHREIFDAIVQRNPHLAADAMRRHLQFSAELWAAISTLISNANALPADQDEVS